MARARSTSWSPSPAPAQTWSPCGGRRVRCWPRPSRTSSPVLLHRRPLVAADDQSLPGGSARDPCRVAGQGVRRGGLQLHAGGPAVANGVGTLDDATGGRPELSRKFHDEMQPFGCDQELLFGLRTRTERPGGWSGCTARSVDRSSPPTNRVVRRVAPGLAAGARHGLLVGQHGSPTFRRHPVWSSSTSGSPSNRRRPRQPDGCPTWAELSSGHRRVSSRSRDTC